MKFGPFRKASHGGGIRAGPLLGTERELGQKSRIELREEKKKKKRQ